MLQFDHVTFSYPGAAEPVIRDLSFTVEAGSFVSVIGASGSGKTTLLRLLNGLEQVQSGTIYADGKPIDGQNHFAAYMPQQDLLFPWFTVAENVMLPMTVQKLPKAEKRRKALEMLERVGLSDWADHYPRELSGGMRQRVSFARTLCAGSSLLLLDEPFSALDSITRISMQEWLREQRSGLEKTVLFITHDVEEALFLSEKVLLLRGKPASSLQSFEVPLPSERSRDMLLRPEIMRLKEQLITELRREAAL